MDVYLEYPMPGYVRAIKRAVNSGDNINVCIADPRLVKMVSETLDEMAVEEESKASFFNFFGRWFRLLKFLTGHFYAVGAEYDVQHKVEESLKVTYRAYE